MPILASLPLGEVRQPVIVHHAQAEAVGVHGPNVLRVRHCRRERLPKGPHDSGGHGSGREHAAQRREVETRIAALAQGRSEEHTSELQSLMRISYAVFCLKKKKKQLTNTKATTITY